MAGNDTINVQSRSSDAHISVAYGGSGDDTYVLSSRSSVIIADCSGNDSIRLPFTVAQLNSYLGSPSTVQAVVDGNHYYFALGTTEALIKDFLVSGKIETFITSDGFAIPFDTLWNEVKNPPYEMNYISVEDLRVIGRELISRSFALCDTLQSLEWAYASFDTSPWFNDSAYMKNKATQAGMTATDLTKAFENALYWGRDGDFLHFIQYGQWEDVSPIASFDANYYFKSKAADFYHTQVSKVTNAQAQNMKDAIHNAGMNAWSHYAQYGTREGIDASASFDTSAYMDAKLAQMKKADASWTMDKLYDAFAQAGLSAAAHYEAYGKAEGLKAVGVPTAYAAMDMQIDAG